LKAAGLKKSSDKLTPENTRNHPIGGDDLNVAGAVETERTFG
jgi:hypothetical protein